MLELRTDEHKDQMSMNIQMMSGADAVGGRSWSSDCVDAVHRDGDIRRRPDGDENNFLCDSSFENCRTPILNMIKAETAGIDVSFWFMTDTQYSTEIIKRWNAGVPVRVLLDLRADANYPSNATVRQSLIAAGIPIRHKMTTGINHWKMILYAGQAKMHFSAANFAAGSYFPTTPYTNYLDEAIYFTNDSAIVESFMTKFDDLWTNQTHFQNLANITTLTRNYPTYSISPDLNFPPDQDYMDRVVAQLKLDTSHGGRCRDLPHHLRQNTRRAYQSRQRRRSGTTDHSPDPVSDHRGPLGFVQRGSDVHEWRRRKGEEE